jgi:hypothetical protein
MRFLGGLVITGVLAANLPGIASAKKPAQGFEVGAAEARAEEDIEDPAG